ncbi:MAG: NAD(P)H-dependent oxidoreductase [Acutalibacteraceae bacterium]
MKIAVINGQNHKGSTWHIGNMLAQKIAGEKDIKEFFLPRDLNHFCVGCYACLKKRENCPYWNEKKLIIQAILEADLIIFTTPNYCMMPSAPMKAFLDLFFTNWLTHKPYKEMFSKRAVVISTAAGAGAAKASKLLADNLINWGIAKVTSYSINVNALNWDGVPDKKKAKIEKDMNRLSSKLSRERKVKVSLKTRFLFGFYGGMQKANWGASPEEKQYWIDMGWLDGKKPWKE